MTSCWSKGRNTRYAYYFCDQKGCPDHRKSIRREKVESEFETILRTAQPAPFLRRNWMVGWLAVCSRHRTVLMRNCPHCELKLVSQWLRESGPTDLRRCKRCGGVLAQANGLPGVGAAIELQEAMLAVKRVGIGEIPGLGVMEWRSFTVIVDLVVKVVWTKAKAHARQDLFTQIVSDFSLEPAQRHLMDWRSNYAALILMAWMLADWPCRLRQTLELLNAPAIDDILGELHSVDNALRAQVRTEIRDVLSYRRQPENWQKWLLGMVEAGTDFRALALERKNRSWKARFTALAMLSEGRTIEEAAVGVHVGTAMINRWLEIGTAYGIDAVRAKSLRICDLTSGQVDEIADWFRSRERTASGPTGWTREQARREITARFGLLISTNAAYQLLLDSRPRQSRS